ncbi:MAG: hypothetical protein ACRDKL_06540 [Solirubrobacteraceae bacterium]
MIDAEAQRRAVWQSVGYPPPARGEPHWPPQLVIAIAVALQWLVPDRLSAGPRWLLPAIEALVLLSLVLASPQRLVEPHPRRRQIAITATAVASIANAVSLGLLCHNLFKHNPSDGHALIGAGALIWLTNILIFSLWYWELDRGGPGTRAAGRDEAPDFLFPQMTARELCPDWRPRFPDYVYVALTNAMAISPTDAMPVSVRMKTVMGLQSLISLVTIGLVISRAVNIL